MSLIGNCLARLVARKAITQASADAALALHEGLLGKLSQDMSPARADAAAALEAARVMADAAQRRKLKIAQDAIRGAEVRQRMAEHPKGPSAGLISALTFDPWGAQRGISVESHSETVLGYLFKRANDFLEPYRSTAAGLRQDLVGVRNAVRELFDVDTGDPVAKAAAAAWRGAVKGAVERAKKAGVDFAELVDWRLPQFWERSRVAKFGRAEMLNDVLAAVDGKGLQVLDAATGQPAARDAIPGIVERAFDDITAGRRSGAGGGFDKRMRVFRYQNPETWLTFADKYGAGRGGVYSMMVGHMAGMAREIALAEVLGPSHRGAMQLHLDKARRGTAEQGFVARTLTGPRMAELAYQDLTGQLSAPVSDKVAGWFGAVRNIKTASSLGSATISAVPGDSVNTAWAANANGIPAVATITRAMELTVADSATKRADAARMNVVAHAVMDSVLFAKRFEDQIVGQNATGRLASTVMRASGLQGWTNGLKRSWSMETFGMIAGQADKSFDAVDPAFRRFLERYGFTPAEWDQLRATPLLEVEGATFFDVEAAGKLGDRLNSAILDERRYAVIEPTALTRAITTGGTKRGTIVGEIVRSSFMFKSYAVSILLTHVMRAVTTGPWQSRVFRTAAFVATSTIAGALAIQAKQIIAGKDPRDMTTQDFWWAAVAQGGGAGIYGDLIYQSATRGGQGLLSTLAGPVLGEVGGTIDLAATGIHDLIKGPSRNGRAFGQALTEWMKRWTPGSTLWYTRLATDRYLFDFIQSMVDANYPRALQRQQSRAARDGQRFWWAPGEKAPARAPDLSAAMGEGTPRR